MASPLPNFDPDFATPSEWAAMYRACGLQVVPARYPMRDRNGKRPGLASWVEFQEAPVSDAIFATWFGPEARVAPNMGMITGRASGNVLVVDLDEHEKPEARYWWQGALDVHAGGFEPETVCQVTGGGGRQLLFRAPVGWHAPTNKTPIGVDIRGQGGFAMLPPSMHYCGREYAWAPGRAPWEVEIADAPEWLLDAIDRLVEQFGGDRASDEAGRAQTRTASPSDDFDAFGARVDGRDDAMTKWVWRSVLELHRACDGVLPDDDGKAHFEKSLEGWLRNTKTRLKGVDNVEGLERECRGPSAFLAKWKRAMAKWQGRVAREAGERRESAQPHENEWNEQPRVDPETGEPLPLILTAAQFVADFTPPEYLIDGMVQRGYVYSFTARTGHGKTAVGMYVGQCIARGLAVAGRAVEQGSVLFLAGENPDDVRARFLVLADRMGFDLARVPFYFVAGIINIENELERISAAAEKIGNLKLVIVDTAAAYFPGDDTNSNAQQGAYARLLRRLSFLPGKPAIIIPSHPVKNAAKDNLLPLGGGAFLNEVDGNLTLWSDAERQTTLHWQGKFRGPEFEPMTFRLDTVTSEKVVDVNGVCLPSVVALPVSEIEREMAEGHQLNDTIAMMFAMDANRNASVSVLARAARFVGENGEAQKSKAFRVLRRLVEDKLAEVILGKYRLTAKGRREIGRNDED